MFRVCGGGCFGSFRFSFSRILCCRAFGSVYRGVTGTRPSVAGMCTSTSSIAERDRSISVGGQPWGGPCELHAQRHRQAEGQEHHEDLTLDWALNLTVNRSQVREALPCPWRLLHLNELRVPGPQQGRLFLAAQRLWCVLGRQIRPHDVARMAAPAAGCDNGAALPRSNSGAAYHCSSMNGNPATSPSLEWQDCGAEFNGVGLHCRGSDADIGLSASPHADFSCRFRRFPHDMRRLGQWIAAQVGCGGGPPGERGTITFRCGWTMGAYVVQWQEVTWAVGADASRVRQGATACTFCESMESFEPPGKNAPAPNGSNRRCAMCH